jgi:FdhE protein
MNLETWLAAHSYLRPLARLTAQVEEAADAVGIPPAAVPDWEIYADEFREGVPLLTSVSAPVDADAAGTAVFALVERLAAGRPAEGPLTDITLVATELRLRGTDRRGIVEWLLGQGDGYDRFAPCDPGLLRYVGWSALARHLAPVRDAFGIWRSDKTWLRGYCPMCASAPAMAQLIGVDEAHARLLVCGMCRSRWPYVRTACPFCESDQQKQTVFVVEGEAGLRIDYCEKCLGYLKTYAGQTEEPFLLSDWTSVHLDFAARDRGLKRTAASLYDLDSVLPVMA